MRLSRTKQKHEYVLCQLGLFLRRTEADLHVKWNHSVFNKFSRKQEPTSDQTRTFQFGQARSPTDLLLQAGDSGGGGAVSCVLPNQRMEMVQHSTPLWGQSGIVTPAALTPSRPCRLVAGADVCERSRGTGRRRDRIDGAPPPAFAYAPYG